MSYRINPNSKRGWIELITGCMFAGKTEEFIRRLKRYEYAKQKVLVFKPAMENRYSKDNVTSHSGLELPAIRVKNSNELREHVFRDKDVKIIGVDEVQFLDTDIVDVLSEIADKGIIVVANGLDKDYRNDPFQNVDKLLVQAEYVDKLTSICYVCGGNASRTQRIVGGVPAKADEPLVLLSANEKYEARCRHCYIKPE
ncbi:thymidine kinase [Spiroplasma helicoides]|uniref:Thymidine kinase n=1 Tax=Spiroplasma helicoides TaxID=216938 RepID=A0A1B3SMB2_9MOLU|nr:thymidine kinase [Spiroplasma helicoides]AOG61050.1 thymidine kinase [Spiroplasma helicoides]